MKKAPTHRYGSFVFGRRQKRTNPHLKSYRFKTHAEYWKQGAIEACTAAMKRSRSVWTPDMLDRLYKPAWEHAPVQARTLSKQDDPTWIVKMEEAL